MTSSDTILNAAKVAYFSMEIGLRDDLPTYSGGLGVLAGDTIKAAADIGAPMVAVTLLYSKGYFKQALDQEQGQSELAVDWQPENLLTRTNHQVAVQIADRTVKLKIWRYDVVGASNSVVPVFFLDSNHPDNSAEDKKLTDCLYGGDNHYRLCQEIVLGIGGMRALSELGCSHLQKYHMNEGHAAFLTIELLAQQKKLNSKEQIGKSEIEAVKRQAMFTTHTPVPAGHDRFTLKHLQENLGDIFLDWSDDEFCSELKKRLLEDAYGETFLNMTHLALNLSSYVNAVARRHAEVSRQMFPGYKIDAITNGIHAETWLAVPLAELFNEYLPGWQQDNYLIRNAQLIPREKLWQAHQAAKQLLIDEVNATGQKFNRDVFTIGFARRFATYKRADLIFDQPDRLNKIADEFGGLQLVFSGKAHPKDEGGKELIKKVLAAQRNLSPRIKLAFLPNYSMRLGALITAGVDLWLNNPRRPLEASGTSGMKAALNGVPNLSILDGWWIEGCIDGVTGWAIGSDEFEKLDLAMTSDEDRSADAEALYCQLEKNILPLFHQHRDEFINIMQSSMALCGSYFNTQRMVNEYVMRGYF